METLQRTANRGSVSTGYDVANSVKLEADNSEFFIRTVSSAGSRTTGTISLWLKRTELSTLQYVFEMGNVDNDDGRLFARFQTDDTLRIATGSTLLRNTNRVFRDSSAWYHIVVAIDTTQSTANDRVKLYINGVQETSFSTTNNYSEDGTTGLNFGKQTIGFSEVDQTGGFCGYMCEVVIQDGVASAPTEFGKFDSATGIWIPKDASGATMGTNGSYLKFENAASMGAATAGNALSVQNVNQVDQATDTCTNNFCIGNALVNFAPGGQTLVRGATKFSNPSGQNWQTITGTFGLTSGKWYWEFESDGTGAFVGIADVEDSIVPQRTDGYFLGYGDDNSATTKSLGMYSTNGVIYNDSGSATGNSYGSGNRVGVALDMDNRKIYFAVGNTWVNSGDPANGTNGATWNTSWSDTVFPAGSCAQNNSIFFVYGGFSSLSNISNVDANGYGGFYYTPPSGFYALCTKNLAEYG
jgi:hypothetical protein